jgi:hypothetical protein
MENLGFPQKLTLVSTSANYWIIFPVPLITAVCITQLILYQVYPLDKYVLEDAALLVTADSVCRVFHDLYMPATSFSCGDWNDAGIVYS